MNEIEGNQEFASVSYHDSKVSATRQVSDRYLKDYVEALTTDLDRIRSGKAIGMWDVAYYFGARSAGGYAKLASILKSSFVGEASQPEIIRITGLADEYASYLRAAARNLEFWHVRNTPKIGIFETPSLCTPLTSRELAALVNLPEEEMPGFDVYPVVKCAVNPPARDDSGDSGSEIRLGTILDRGATTNNSLTIGKNNLTMHCFISGMPGRGKTETGKWLLSQIRSGEKPTPFIIIEPVKSEYRSLSKAVPGLRVFTLGDEMRYRFRINPFAVPDRVPVIRHIEMLKSVLKASFTMWGPLPQIFEEALYNTYTRRGWGLATSTRGETPDMYDFYVETMRVVDRLEYKKDTIGEIREALRRRIHSLLIAGKGLMFSGHIEIEELLREPTILELGLIADNEEKSFLMGVIFGMIYEHLEARGASSQLGQVILIEEAHRLFSTTSKVAAGGDFTGAHSEAKAVETLSEMIDEARAFGVGIIIVDQTPTKLAPDAIKNTNLKITHGLVDGNERKVMSEAMGLGEEQNQYLMYLARGQAMVSMGGFHGPYLIDISMVESATPQESEALLSETMRAFYDAHAKDFRANQDWERMIALEPLLKQPKVRQGVDDALKKKNDQERIEGLQSVLVDAVKEMGYQEETLQMSLLALEMYLLRETNTTPRGIELFKRAYSASFEENR